MPPAARITDPVAHPLPPILQPGPGSPNVIIGFLPAWRAIPAAAAAGLQAAKQAADIAIQTAVSATAAAAGTPGAPAAYAAEQTTKSSVLASMSSAIMSASGGADIHQCVTPLPVPPHGPGVVINGSPTVLINNLPASRQGDTILEAAGPTNTITMGCTTVIIGVAGATGVSVVPNNFVGPLAPNQITEAENAQVQETLEKIARGETQIKINGTPEYRAQTLDALARLMSRPTGRGLVNDLANAPHTTTIEDTGGAHVGNTENAANFNAGLYDYANNRPGPGSDNTVNWNPQRTKIDGEDWQTRDPAIGLGHELVHSYHDVHGTTDGRNPVPYVDANGNNRQSPGYEQQAAGVGTHAGDRYTENNMRREHDGTISSLGRQEPQRPRY
jgi:uncharacterized Zn-binding protein involved in type VI secretion